MYMKVDLLNFMDVRLRSDCFMMLEVSPLDDLGNLEYLVLLSDVVCECFALDVCL